MFRKKLIAKTPAILLTLLAMIALYQTTFAGCCASQSFAGSVANARKDNMTLDSTRWRAAIESAMGSYGEGPPIDVIGWTWWNVYEMCNGYVIELTSRDPVSASNRAYQSRYYDQVFNTCNSSKVTGNSGRHQFEEGSATYYPNPVYTKSFP